MVKYKELAGTSFHEETPIEVMLALNTARVRKTKIRIFLGDATKVWEEENDVLGYVGRSTGTVKIPLMLESLRSTGGGGILGHCIVRIQEAKTGKVLYQSKSFEVPSFSIEPADKELKEMGYNTSVFNREKQNCANFKTESEAFNYVAFMRGERMSNKY